MYRSIRQYAMIALAMVASATLLFSCDSKTNTTEYDLESLITESSEEREITMMENGKRTYTFTTPLMEGYSLATNPYQEFRRGIKLTTYTDTLSLVDATITSNYAIYYERQKLWEAKGNVVIIKNNREEGDTTVTGHTEIYTQQLFWNATTKKIYSNVDTKVLQPDGWHFGVGFDADEDLKNIHFRKYSSEVEFDMSQPSEEEREEREAKRAEEDKEKKDKKKEQTKDMSQRVNNNTVRGINNSANKRNDRPANNQFSPAPVRPTNIKNSTLKNESEVAPPDGAAKMRTTTFGNESLNLNVDTEAAVVKRD